MLVTKQPVLRRFWYALFQVSELDNGKPKPFRLLGEDLVVWKRPNGEYAALQDRCCHRTAKLSKGWVDKDTGDITCGYHGWRYDATGACTKIPQFNEGERIPSAAKVPAFHCQEKYGYIWVALEDPLRPIPEFPEDGAPGYRRIFQFYQHWKTSPVRFMENSFDNSHFSFVHFNTFGQIDQPRPQGYELEMTDFGFQGQTTIPIANPPEAHQVVGSSEPTVNRILTNRYYVPFVRRFGCQYESGIDHIIYNCATPIDDGNIMLVQWLYRNDTEEQCPEQKLIDWDLKITIEDKDILESTDPDACVDVRRKAEVHMPSDKPGLVIRRMLMDVLQEHGEAEVYRGSEAAAGAAPAQAAAVVAAAAQKAQATTAGA